MSIRKCSDGTTKHLLVIDSLTSGGAERQILQLAEGLAEEGGQVYLLTYYSIDHYHSSSHKYEKIELDMNGYSIFRKLHNFRKVLKKIKPEVVIAYKESTSLYFEVLKIVLPSMRLVVSERNSDVKSARFKVLLKCLMHFALSDHIVCNSEAQRKLLLSRFGWLSKKMSVIENGVDLESFTLNPHKVFSDAGRLRVGVFARFSQQKNPRLLVDAMKIIITDNADLCIDVVWYGNNYLCEGVPSAASFVYLETVSAIRDGGLEAVFKTRVPVKDVGPEMQLYDVVLLCSDYEGYPNVIGEAFASGVPVIASSAGDSEKLIRNSKAGYVFDVGDVHGLVNSLEKICMLTAVEKFNLGMSGRVYAEREISVRENVQKHMQLVNCLNEKS